MHNQDSQRRENRQQTRRCYPSSRQARREVVLNCQIGDRIQVGDSVELVVRDMRGDDVVLDVDDSSADFRLSCED